MSSDEKYENLENNNDQLNTPDQEPRADSNSTEKSNAEKMERTEQHPMNGNLEAKTDTELPPKPEGQGELEAKKDDGYEHVSESAVNLDHAGELQPTDIPPSLGGEAEINFPWDDDEDTAQEDSPALTQDAKLPEEAEEDAELPANIPEADLPVESDETAVQTPEEVAKQQTEVKYLAELPYVKIFHPQNADEETKIFTLGELEKTQEASEDSTLVAGEAVKEEKPKEPQNRKEARKAKREERKKNPRGPIRYLPVWLRLIIVIALCFAGLIIGLVVGYGLIGDGENPQDVLKIEFWQSIYDYIQGK
ncbi:MULTISPECIES: DNA-directed RNA polymerase subunit beta [Allobacillus]|nr:DNA-directed RNA polymerase subunit beta [Allobacillus salarius]